MLKIIRATTRRPVRPADAELEWGATPNDKLRNEDDLLRAAFGRFSRPSANIIRKARQLTDGLRREGCWIECDCRSEANIRPALFCVQNRGVRRDPRGVAHDQNCDFFFYPREQVELVKTYTKPGLGDLRTSFDLLRDFQIGETLNAARGTRTSRGEKRSQIAAVLFSLLSLSKIDVISPNEGPYWDLREQLTRLRAAAGEIRISGRPLQDWIAFDPIEFEGLKTRLAAQSTWEGKTPYGMYVFSPTTIDGKRMMIDGLAGPVAIFGEMPTFGEQSPVHRHPYLVAAVVARVAEGHEPTLIRAYVHPCLSAYRWTLVDSNLERATFQQLLKVRYRVLMETGLNLYIAKPGFDIGPAIDEPRVVCIPDFILSLYGGDITRECVIVETMGGFDEDYGDRKREVHELFRMIGQRSDGEPTPIEEFEPPSVDAEKPAYLRGFRDRVSERFRRMTWGDDDHRPSEEFGA